MTYFTACQQALGPRRKSGCTGRGKGAGHCHSSGPPGLLAAPVSSFWRAERTGTPAAAQKISAGAAYQGTTLVVPKRSSADLFFKSVLVGLRPAKLHEKPFELAVRTEFASPLVSEEATLLPLVFRGCGFPTQRRKAAELKNNSALPPLRPSGAEAILFVARLRRLKPCPDTMPPSFHALRCREAT